MNLESPFKPDVHVVDGNPAVCLAYLSAISDAENGRSEVVRGPNASCNGVTAFWFKSLHSLRQFRSLSGLWLKTD